jgi:hypothetical protein
MSLLKKLFGRTEKNNSLSQPERDSLSARTPQELIEIFGGVAFEKQLHFGDIIGTNNWSVDIAESNISFGPGPTLSRDCHKLLSNNRCNSKSTEKKTASIS